MATPQETTKRKLPGAVDIAYDQYKRDLQRNRTAQELMSQDIITTTPETSLDEAARIMGSKHIGSLIVMQYKTPVGIITERDLLSKVLALGLFLSDEKVKEIMSYPLTGISRTAKIKEIAQLMISKKGRLAVFDAGLLVGIVTASDLIKSLPSVPETEVKVDDFMTKPVVTADEKTSIIDIARIMGKQRIGSVIISHQGEPFGIFTERDLLTSFLAKSKALFTEVGPTCSTPLINIAAGTSVHKAAATMALKHVRRLPVTQDDKLVGIITARDLVEVYTK
ncbi:MAG: cyclic nucleotide-binding/CBS domain-containing protein [Chloroflexota bacterium]|nr:CBS domain-containing protein [Candidatus Sulfotelmatobacter sp.]